MTTGIYCIIGPKNRYYVGQSQGILNRIAKHREMLLTGSHYNKKLQNAWNKYGEAQFIFKILEKHPKGTCLNEHEQRWMNFYEAVTAGYKHMPTCRKSVWR